jgi:Domain of unknown function (DUF2828)
MTTLLNELKKHQSETITENGAATFNTTLNANLDFFAMGASLRERNETEVILLFSKAFAEDKLLALKNLFYIRDIRGGAGERKTFRTCLKWLADMYPSAVAANYSNVVHYGRWDDLFTLKGTKVWFDILGIVKNKWFFDTTVDLFWKWMPSNNTSSNEARKLAEEFTKHLGITPRTYRKRLSEMRKQLKIVERNMCSKEWDQINYSAVPSKASLNYSKAFLKNDHARYTQYLSDVKSGKTKINAATLYPYDIVAKAWDHTIVSSPENAATLDVLWNALPNYMPDDHGNGLVVADVSGSMSGLPMQVSISLAMYISERNKGIFKDHFITFSGTPQLQKITGSTIFEKVSHLQRADWGMNTDLEAVFDLILRKAVSAKIPANEMPDKVYIISDMEFDVAAQNPKSTLFDLIDSNYNSAGYVRPELVFWNVNSRNNNTPVRFDQRGVCLVSGCSPSILKSLLAGEIESPQQLMLSTLNVERYERVVV